MGGETGQEQPAQPKMVDCDDCHARVTSVISAECDACGKAFDVCGDCEPIDGVVYICSECDEGGDDDDAEDDGSQEAKG